MKSISLIALLAMCQLVSFAQNNGLYAIKLPSIDGGQIKLNEFEGKKILLVNGATQTKLVEQLSSLEQLHQRLKDSNLVIIFCPSNSFGNEPGSNKEVQQYISNRFSPHFIITAKIETIGEDAHPIYKWIASKDLNGVLNGKVKGDFTKYLINEEGLIRGFYSSEVDPQNSVIIGAIRVNN